MGTAFIILLLLALCGFIAYIGDLLGRRFGKKRLSVFGLRPKHTAIVLTIATGVLIAGVTFAAALATLPWFRNVVTQGEQLAYRNASLLRANEEEARKNRRLEESQKQLQGENQHLQSTNQMLEKRNGELAGTNKKLRADSEKLKSQNAALTAANSGLREQNTVLKAQSGALKGQNTSLRGANTRLAQSNTRLQQAVSSLKGQQERLNQVLDTRRLEVQSLQEIAANYRASDYIFERDRPIETLAIPRNPPLDTLRELLNTILFRVEEQARRKGAAASDTNAVVYYVRPIGYPFGRPTTPGYVHEWVVRWVNMQRNRNIVVRAVASENCVAGRPVPVRLECFVNERVFAKGELITDRPCRLNGRSSDGTILTELIFYLQNDVRNAARSREMLPYAEETEFGDLWYDRLLSVCRKVKESNGWVNVVARARTDINRTGPLSVDLEVLSVNDALRSDAR